MKKENEILDFLKQVKKTIPNAKEMYTKGNCTSLAMMLKVVFPGGKVLHNLDHAVHQIGNRCYDITGRVPKPRGAMPIEDYGTRIMIQLMQNNYV